MVYENALDNLNERLWMDDAKLNELKWYKDLYELIQSQWTEWLWPKFSKNLDFIKQKNDEYNDVFSKRNIKYWTINDFYKKYWWWSETYRWTNLKWAVWKASDEYNKANDEIINKIETLWWQYWNEKSSLFNKIQSDHDALRAWALWQEQEQLALAEWLSTRRWMWTKAMEDVSKSSIENQTNTNIWNINADETSQIQWVAKLYNELLSNLIQQYKSTKDQYVLWKIQNAVNILNILKWGKSTTE